MKSRNEPSKELCYQRGQRRCIICPSDTGVVSTALYVVRDYKSSVKCI